MSKTCVILDGPNGSGKTTFAREFLKIYDWPFLNADEIAAEMSPDNVAAVAVAAGREFLHRLKHVIEDGRDFVLESTLSGLTLRRSIERCRERSFHVAMNMIFLGSADASIRRIKGRVEKGGHFVPDEDVRRRYIRSLTNFWTTYRFIVDEWTLFYNGNDQFTKVASGAGDEFEVYNEGAMGWLLNVAQGDMP